MESIKPSQVYTTNEAQEYLKISKSTIKRLLKNGILRANKIGGQYRILGHELLRLVSPRVDQKATNLYQKIKQRTKSKIQDW